MVNVVQKIASMLYDISRCNRFEFDRQTSRCVTFDSSVGTARLSMIPLSHFEDDPPLCSGHATVRAYDHVCPFLCGKRNGQNSTFRELAAWRQQCARRYIVYDPAVR